MRVERIAAAEHALVFRQVVWLFPALFALHVAEEWPHFVTWAQRYASPLYSRREYLIAHLGGIALAIVIAAVLSRWPNRALVFLGFALAFLPGLLFNAIFHLGATLRYRAYSPGAITAAALYLPYVTLLIRLAWREGLLGGPSTAAALVIAGAFHVAEVGHNVFKAW